MRKKPLQIWSRTPDMILKTNKLIKFWVIYDQFCHIKGSINNLDCHMQERRSRVIH